MNLTTTTTDLAAALRTVSRAMSSRAVLPILSNVILAADADGLRVTATDLEKRIEAAVPATVGEAGTAALPAKLLREFLGAVPAGSMSLAMKGTVAHVKAMRHTATLRGMDPAEFPAAPAVSGAACEVTLNAAEFGGVVSHALVAADKSGARPILGGVLLSLDGLWLNCAGADGYRLGTAKMKTPHTSEASAIVPAESLRGMEWGAGDVTLHVSASHVRIEAPGMTLWAQTLEGRFPDFTAIIPREAKTWVVVDTAELAAAVRVAALFARDSANLVRLAVADGEPAVLTLRATSVELGDNESTLSAQAQGGPAIESALNARYLADALAVIESPAVRLEWTTPARPVVVRPTEGTALHVVMPMAERR